MRRTKAVGKIAATLLDADPGERHWGYDLSKRAGVRSGVLYPMLWRMLEAGWLADGWEDPTQIREKRPPRRYYTVTSAGRAGLAGLRIP